MDTVLFDEVPYRHVVFTVPHLPGWRRSRPTNLVDIENRTRYALSPSHPRRRHKARVFAAVLGLTARDTDRLHQALLLAAHVDSAVPAERDSYGQRYVIDFDMTGPRGATVKIRSAWMVRID